MRTPRLPRKKTPRRNANQTTLFYFSTNPLPSVLFVFGTTQKRQHVESMNTNLRSMVRRFTEALSGRRRRIRGSSRLRTGLQWSCSRVMQRMQTVSADRSSSILRRCRACSSWMNASRWTHSTKRLTSTKNLSSMSSLDLRRRHSSTSESRGHEKSRKSS